MHRTILTFLGILGFLTSFSQVSKKSTGKYLPGKFASLKYDKVIAYDFDGSKQVIVSLGKLQDSLIKKKVTLSSQQIDTLQSFLFNTNSYGVLPDFNSKGGHLGIVYFSNNKIIGHITISLEENRVIVANFDIPASSFKKIKYPGQTYYVNAEGFSVTGQEKIKSFCKSLGFLYGEYELSSKSK